MNKKAVWRSIVFACIILSVLFGTAGLTRYQIVQARSGGPGCAAEGGMELTRMSVEWIREQEKTEADPVEFTAWTQKNAERVTSLDGNRSASMPVIEISGSSEHLLPYGRILQESDRSGCIIGEKTAEILFGSRDIEGLSVAYQGREYVVRDVVEDPGEFLIVQALSPDTVFDRIVFARNSGDSGAGGDDAGRRAEQFFVRYGITAKSILRAGFSGESSLREFLPGKWSDFAGWIRNFKDYSREKQQMEEVPKSIFEITAEEMRTRAVWLLVAGGLFGASGLLFTRKPLTC